MSTFRISRHAAAAKKAVEPMGKCKAWQVYLFTFCDVLSHLMVLLLAWVSTAYVIIPYFALHYALAALRAPDLLDPFKRPITMLTPQKASAFKLGGKDESWFGGCGFYLVSYAIRTLVFFTINAVVLTNGPKKSTEQATKEMCTRSDIDCERLPKWLQQECAVDPEVYFSCFQKVGWYLSASCNTRAAQCSLQADKSFEVILEEILCFVFMFVLPFAAFLLAGVGWLCWIPQKLCCDADDTFAERVLKDEELQLSETASAPPSAMQRASVTMEVAFSFIDVLSDLNCIVAYVLTGNLMFAACALMIFLGSFLQEIYGAGVGDLLEACRDSMATGQLSDRYYYITLPEKVFEAPLSLFLQVYTFIFVMDSPYAGLSFIGSMLLSLRSITRMEYELLHLDLMEIVLDTGAGTPADATADAIGDLGAEP